MAAVNFPLPSASPWTNPANGVTYEYSNGVWKAISGGTPLDDRYVAVAGDNMTGNLTLGTEAGPALTTLNANGDASFGGKVGVGTTTPGSFSSSTNNLVVSETTGNSGITLHTGSTHDSYLGFTRTGNTSNQGYLGYRHPSDSLVFATNSTEHLVIDSSGTATFDSQVGIGTTGAIGSNISLAIDNGRALFQADDEKFGLGLAYNASTSPMFLGSPGVNEFEVCYPSGATAFQVGASGAEIVVGASGISAFNIDSSGNVGIAGSVQSGGDPNDGGAVGTKMTSTGVVQATRSSGASAVFMGYTQGTTTPTARINGNGDAYFLGNVGIGTTAPQRALQVGTHGSGNGEIALASSTSGNCSILMGDGATGTDLYRGYIQYNNSSDAMLFATSAAERVRIDSSGRLLVNTSSSSAVSNGEEPFLQVKGTDSRGGLSVARFSNDANASGLYIGKSRGTSIGSNTIVSSGDELGRITFSGSDGTDLNTQAASIQAYVDGTPGSNDMPGRLVFSTTADGASSPTERMRVDSSGVVFTRNPTTTSLIVATGGASSSSNPVFAVRHSATTITSGTNAFFVYSNGSYATVSDQSQKKNIESTRDGYLEDLNRLRVVKYNWNEQEDTEPKELGLIAQEVEQVFPRLISQMNEDGEEPIKGVKFSVLPIMLLKALQEASAKIETLEAKVAALEAR